MTINSPNLNNPILFFKHHIAQKFDGGNFGDFNK